METAKHVVSSQTPNGMDAETMDTIFMPQSHPDSLLAVMTWFLAPCVADLTDCRMFTVSIAA